MQGSIKQCNQALSKYPKNNLFNVLKALAHDRLGDSVKAVSIVEDIIATRTADDEVLHHCSDLLRRLGDYEVLLQLYKSASAEQPQDLGLQQVNRNPHTCFELSVDCIYRFNISRLPTSSNSSTQKVSVFKEILFLRIKFELGKADAQELFLAHVRLGNVLEQQQLAMKINKAVPGELQTFWVVCSMLTQAIRARFGAGAGMSQEMLLKLAAGLISKHLQREEGMSYEGVLVYLDILLAQGSFEECMQLLEGTCSRAVQIPHDLLRLKVCFLHHHCCLAYLTTAPRFHVLLQ
jgi:tetratricopeptide (TPR) repeat protein